MKYKVTNWPEYEAGLRRRGSLTFWVTAEALAAWQAPPRKTRGGQPRYSDLAIEVVLTLGCVFGLRLRQSEGLMLDTNPVENTIRPVALTRKNALFAGHEVGAENWALLASIIATCKLSDINPVDYIAEALRAILDGHPQNRIEDLMPWNFPKASRSDA